MRAVYFVATLFLLIPLSGCIGGNEAVKESLQVDEYYPNIYDRKDLEWSWNGSYSMVLNPGPYSPRTELSSQIIVGIAPT